METLRELWEFLRERKKLWLLPIIIILMGLGFIMFVGAQAGVLSPFIYAM